MPMYEFFSIRSSLKLTLFNIKLDYVKRSSLKILKRIQWNKKDPQLYGLNIFYNRSSFFFNSLYILINDQQKNTGTEGVCL